METKNQESKNRTVSSTSSNNSVTEYVNEMYVESELELSKVVSIQVDQSTKSPTENISEGLESENQKQKKLQDFSEASDSTVKSSQFIPRGFRKMYLAALVSLLFATCMGVTATYSATAGPKIENSTLAPTDDQLSWVASLMPVGALVGGTAGVMISKLTIFLSVFGWMFLDTVHSARSEEDYFNYQYSNEIKPSLKQFLIQRIFDSNAFEDNLTKIREAGLKRAKGLEKIPPGFVGVRGKKSDKLKVKEPFPGFLGVRGKKYLDREKDSVDTLSSMDDLSPLSRYFQTDNFNFKGEKHH